MTKGTFGFNGTIGSQGSGSRQVRVMALNQWIGIIAGSQASESRSRRAMYPVVTTSSSFEVTLQFLSYAERQRFNNWLTNYMLSIVGGTAQSGVMTVSVPSRKFLKVAVPETEVTFGEGFNDVGYTLTLGFCGATDPLDLDLGARMAGISYFKPPTSGRVTKFFYPAGEQVKGAESLDGTIFDTTPSDETPSDTESVDPFAGFGPW